jgi:putative transposase
MAKRRLNPEQMAAKLRQIEVLTAGGKALPLACKKAGITDVTYHCWHREYGGLKSDPAKRLKEKAFWLRTTDNRQGAQGLIA